MARLKQGLSKTRSNLAGLFGVMQGASSDLRTGLPLLQARGMVATAFLCGAWIGSAANRGRITVHPSSRMDDALAGIAG